MSASPERAFSLDYSAPHGCPDRAAVIAAIQARASQSLYVAEGHAKVHFRIELLDGGQSSLSVELPEGASRREFEEPVCRDAVSSMAVIAAMVLEAVPGERLAATEKGALPLASATPQASVAPKPKAGPASAPNAANARRAATSDPTRPPARSDRRWGFAVSAGPALETGASPAVPVAFTLGLTAASHGRGLAGASARAELLVSVPGATRAAVGEAMFQLVAGRLSACPARLALASRLSTLPCATFDAGSLRAAGSGAVEDAHSRHMPWVAGGVSLRLEFATSQRLSFEASTSLRALAFHDRFVFLPSTLVYQVPGWSAGLGVGAALTLD